MNADTGLFALSTLISLAGLWFLVAWCYRWYRVDLFRHRVFVLRAELFDFAADEGIPFAHPAYGNLRYAMNGFLRFADRIGLINALMVAPLTRRVDSKAWKQDWEDAVATLPESAREKMQNLRMRLHIEVGKQFVLGSPILIVMLVPPLLLFILQLVGKLLINQAVKGLRSQVAAALEYFAGPYDGLAYRVGMAPSVPALAPIGFHRR